MAETTGRMAKLQAMLEKQPEDPFLLYSMALEHKKVGNTTLAIEFFDRTLRSDSAYCYAYYQKGQTLEALGETESARRTYQRGIEAAIRAGDAHARGEIEGALAQLE